MKNFPHFKHRWNRIFLMVPAALLGILLPGPQSVVSGQGNTGSIGGVTQDEQRRALPAVSLTIQDTQSSLKRTLTSSGDGSFEFSGLPPGEYNLFAELANFQRRELQINLEVNQRLRIDVVLLVGSLNERVEIVAAAPLIHDVDAAV